MCVCVYVCKCVDGNIIGACFPMGNDNRAIIDVAIFIKIRRDWL